MSNNVKVFTVIGTLTLAIIIGGVFLLSKNPSNPDSIDVTTACVTHGSFGMHIHPHLTIKILGQQQEIPANIGIVSDTCMRPVHTHDNTGKIHLEFPKVADVKLGDFFKVWSKPFSKDQILDYKVDDKNGIKVMVNGKPNFDFENLMMKDLDQIVIEYVGK